MFSLFKKKVSPLSINVKAPVSVSVEDLSMPVELTFSCPQAATVNSLVIRLRGDLLNRKQAPNAAPFQYLGELTYNKPVKMAPLKPEQLTVNLPLDFSARTIYEIPPENLSMASDAMKAAAATSQNVSYSYNVEVIAKTEGSDAETIVRQPIQLIDPESVRAASF